MEKNKIKVIALLAVIIGLAFTVNFIAGNASVKAANAWSKTTHQTATDCAFNALNNDNKSAVNSFYTSKILSYRLVNGDIFGGTVNGNAKNALAEISQYPDIDEKGSHGYNITSYQRGGYYRGENDVPIYISSRTKLEEHYSMALSSYKTEPCSTIISLYTILPT